MEFSIETRVYLEDSDAQGIVYYVNYLKFMERARTELLRHLGFDFQKLQSQQGHFVVHSVDARYLKPAYVDDNIVITAAVVKTAKTYVVFDQKVCRRAGVDGTVPKTRGGLSSDMHPSNEDSDQQVCGDVLCKGQIKIACVNSDTGRPMVIPAEIAKAFVQRFEMI